MQRQQEKNSKLWCGCVAILMCLLLGEYTVSEANAGVSVLYTIDNIQVDEQGKTATKARKKALKSAQKEALMQLFKRLAASSVHFYLEDLKIDNIARMVQKIEVKNEKITNKRYRANVAISFNPEYIRAVLRDNNLPFIDKKSPTILIIPLYHKGREKLLWEANNMWRAMIEKELSNTMLLDIVLPLGDLEDLRYSPSNIKFGNFSQLSALAKKYNAKEIVILEAKNSPRRIHIEMRTLSSEGEGHQLINIMKSKQKEGVLLAKAAHQSIMQLEDRWKTKTYKAATEALTLTMAVPVPSLKAWVSIKRRIKALPFLQNIHIKGLTASEINMNVEYRGDLNKLLTKLNEHNFYLMKKDDKLLLRSSI